MEILLKRYDKYREEIQEYMRFFIEALIDKYGYVDKSFIISLDLLAMNLEVLFESKKEMKEKGMSENDKYRGEKKSSSLQAFFNAQNYIHKLIGNFGFTPISSSRIKENKDERDVVKYLEELTK